MLRYVTQKFIQVLVYDLGAAGEALKIVIYCRLGNYKTPGRRDPFVELAVNLWRSRSPTAEENCVSWELLVRN
jgi:hypothetical protein